MIDWLCFYYPRVQVKMLLWFELSLCSKFPVHNSLIGKYICCKLTLYRITTRKITIYKSILFSHLLGFNKPFHIYAGMLQLYSKAFITERFCWWNQHISACFVKQNEILLYMFIEWNLWFFHTLYAPPFHHHVGRFLLYWYIHTYRVFCKCIHTSCNIITRNLNVSLLGFYIQNHQKEVHNCGVEMYMYIHRVH